MNVANEFETLQLKSGLRIYKAISRYLAKLLKLKWLNHLQELQYFITLTKYRLTPAWKERKKKKKKH